MSTPRRIFVFGEESQRLFFLALLSRVALPYVRCSEAAKRPSSYDSMQTLYHIFLECLCVVLFVCSVCAEETVTYWDMETMQNYTVPASTLMDSESMFDKPGTLIVAAAAIVVFFIGYLAMNAQTLAEAQKVFDAEYADLVKLPHKSLAAILADHPSILTAKDVNYRGAFSMKCAGWLTSPEPRTRGRHELSVEFQFRPLSSDSLSSSSSLLSSPESNKGVVAAALSFRTMNVLGEGHDQWAHFSVCLVRRWKMFAQEMWKSVNILSCVLAASSSFPCLCSSSFVFTGVFLFSLSRLLDNIARDSRRLHFFHLHHLRLPFLRAISNNRYIVSSCSCSVSFSISFCFCSYSGRVQIGWQGAVRNFGGRCTSSLAVASASSAADVVVNQQQLPDIGDEFRWEKHYHIESPVYYVHHDCHFTEKNRIVGRWTVLRTAPAEPGDLNAVDTLESGVFSLDIIEIQPLIVAQSAAAPSNSSTDVKQPLSDDLSAALSSSYISAALNDKKVDSDEATAVAASVVASLEGKPKKE